MSKIRHLMISDNKSDQDPATDIDHNKKSIAVTWMVLRIQKNMDGVQEL